MAVLTPDFVGLVNDIFPLLLVVILAVFAIRYRNVLVTVILALVVISNIYGLESEKTDLIAVLLNITNSILISYLFVKEMILEEKQRIATENLTKLTDALEEHHEKP